MSTNDADNVKKTEVVEPEVVADDEGPDEATDASDKDAESTRKKKLSKKEQIAALEMEVQSWQDKYLRLRADFDNFRKRMQREIADARDFSKIGTLEDMLPVLDHFQMAMAYANQNADFETLKQGMDMILTEFERCFENLGVTQVKTVGEAFDPNLHEAVSTESSDDVEEGIVLRETKAGYRLGERLLRAPAVVVSSGPEQPDQDEPAADDEA